MSVSSIPLEPYDGSGAAQICVLVKLPLPSFSNATTTSCSWLTSAMKSRCPSSLRSTGSVLTVPWRSSITRGRNEGTPLLPLPTFSSSRISPVLRQPKTATTRSIRPSPLKSPGRTSETRLRPSKMTCFSNSGTSPPDPSDGICRASMTRPRSVSLALNSPMSAATMSVSPSPSMSKSIPVTGCRKVAR